MTGEGLRLIRIFKNLKVKEMAVKLDISPNYLSEIETGKKIPSLEIIQKYADVLDTSPAVILFFADIKNTDSIAKTKIKDFVRKNIIKFLRAIEEDADEMLRD